ncbi:unnamed protein product [Vicia faba]|uniref:DUF7915 domain-containing protein n=1 Tax=Vicia faba TaxID=3906 RepID=A0AAV0Z0B2_VICFA|nr:unnamed protein product [Vicia faba]
MDSSSSGQNSAVTNKIKHAYKKKKVIKNPTKHSKQKTASRFYIMKCSQLTGEGFIKVPMKDLIQSFQGPLVKRSSNSWTDTPVVQYFHVLPYSEIISEWFSRETFSNSLQDLELVDKQFLKLEVTKSSVSSEGMSFGLDNKPCSDIIEALNLKETNGFCSNNHVVLSRKSRIWT